MPCKRYREREREREAERERERERGRERERKRGSKLATIPATQRATKGSRFKKDYFAEM